MGRATTEHGAHEKRRPERLNGESRSVERGTGHVRNCRRAKMPSPAASLAEESLHTSGVVRRDKSDKAAIPLLPLRLPPAPLRDPRFWPQQAVAVINDGRAPAWPRHVRWPENRNGAAAGNRTARHAARNDGGTPRLAELSSFAICPHARNPSTERSHHHRRVTPDGYWKWLRGACNAPGI